MSWDVALVREGTFDLGRARELLAAQPGFEEVEPGMGEVTGDGYAEIYYGDEPSSDIMVSVRVGADTIFRLIADLAQQLELRIVTPEGLGLPLTESYRRWSDWTDRIE